MRCRFGQWMLPWLMLACGDDAGAGPDAGTPADEVLRDAGERDAATMPIDAGKPTLVPGQLVHSFPSLTVAPGEEDNTLCLSWTLDNDEIIWVREVAFDNDGAFHHSNWTFASDSMFPGPDGAWPCAERGYGLIDAAIGGGVFFAQSTQAREEAQRFADGAAFGIPPRSRIIGQLHLLNVTEDEIVTTPRFDVRTLAQDEVETPLNPMAFTNLLLDLVPGATTVASMDCAPPQPDFALHYVLPHYHALGVGMTIEVVGGPEDGREVFRTDVRYGEAAGQVFDPPISLQGVTSLRISCRYENAGDQAVSYGPTGADEMCVVLLFTDSADRAGGFSLAQTGVEEADGERRTTGQCLVIRQSDAVESGLVPAL